MSAKFSRQEVAKIFGVTEEELADDNGYAEARKQADAEREAFIKRLKERAAAMVAAMREP